MFARSLWLLTCLTPVLATPAFALEKTLPNGIRWIEWPGDSGTRVVAGYRTGQRHETASTVGLSSVASRYLASRSSMRSLVLHVRGMDGTTRFFRTLDASGVEITLPRSAPHDGLAALAAYFKPIDAIDPSGFTFATGITVEDSLGRQALFGARVEDEIRAALLGPHPYHHPDFGRVEDIEQRSAEELRSFLNFEFGTDRAFVLVSGPVPKGLESALAEIPARRSSAARTFSFRLTPAERTLHFSTTEDLGGVVLAAPVSGVFYSNWYHMLVLDRLMRRVLGDPDTRLEPTIDAYYYRLQARLAAGQAPEQAEEHLIQELQRLQYVRSTPEQLKRAQDDALGHLGTDAVREWFAVHDLTSRLEEGRQWVRAVAADDLRALARDVLASNRVLASWSPHRRTNTIVVEDLAAASEGSRGPLRPATFLRGATDLTPLPPVAPAPTPAGIEKLSSGVSLIVGETHGLFLAGPLSIGLPRGRSSSGPNGTFWTFDESPGADIVTALRDFPAADIVVFTTSSSAEPARTLWARFQSRATRQPHQPADAATSDVPALFLLQILLERRAIEAGWSDDVKFRLYAVDGSRLQIVTDPARKAKVVEWARAIGAEGARREELEWIRTSAAWRMRRLGSDLRILLWQRGVDDGPQDLSGVSLERIQQAARAAAPLM